MQEKWKDVKGYKGLYQVSNLGRIKRVECHINGIAELNNRITGRLQHRSIKWSNVNEKILKPGTGGAGSNGAKHLFAVLTKNLKNKSYMLDRLVAEHFLKKPNTNKRLFVFHKDFNPQNNNIDNLEWKTFSEIMTTDFYCHNRKEKKIKQSNDYERRLKLSKLKGGKEIKFIYPNGAERKLPSVSIGAEILGVDESSVRKCLTGKCKTVKGCKVQFV